jgi:hypothetical protein
VRRHAAIVLLLASCGSPGGVANDLGGGTDGNLGGGTDGGAVFSCPALVPCSMTSLTCVPTLADAMSHFCGSSYIARIFDCGGYRLIRLSGVDTHSDFYYDANGVLVAVVASGLPPMRDQCTGGPSSFTVPTCQPPRSFCP